jgi:hypothetical protein
MNQEKTTMMPLVFMVETSIHKDDEVLKKQFLFASRKEVELFKDALRPWGGQVTEVRGFFPSTSKTAFNKVMEIIKS